MTCQDCLHGELCMSRTDTIFFNKTEYRDLDNVEKFCEDFKNKADFVEVVRCKNCKKAMEMTEKWNDCEKYFCDRHHSFVLANGFCSDGERRDI